jgi:hypothetical protein
VGLTAAVAIAGVSIVAGVAAVPTIDRYRREFVVAAPGEARARVVASCAPCDWGSAGREAVALRMSVDGKYSQHVVIVRGDTAANYYVSLGPLRAGRHQTALERDPDLSARGAGPASIDVPAIDVLPQDASDESTAQSLAPILYARPNTVGRFTDLPILMWYEVETTPRGRKYRYSVVFTNEDGGTATDRLMATWGRTTDIELVYSVEVDDDGRLLAEQFQGPGHQMSAFHGEHESRHPLLWVSTDNNMVSESGPTRIRYAPVPERFDLSDASRELVMDRSPWTYAIAAKEMFREGKVAENATPGSGTIPDPRRFVHVEACTDLEDAAVSFAVRAPDGRGTTDWYDSDRGLTEFRVVRSGCFRGAVPLPASAGTPSAIRFRAYSRSRAASGSAGREAEGRGASGRAAARVSLKRVNTVFMLNDAFLPLAPLFSWQGSLMLPIDGDWRELVF